MCCKGLKHNQHIAEEHRQGKILKWAFYISKSLVIIFIWRPGSSFSTEIMLSIPNVK